MYCARSPACLGTALHSTSVHDYNTIRPSGDLHCSYNLPGISYSVQLGADASLEFAGNLGPNNHVDILSLYLFTQRIIEVLGAEERGF